MNTRKVLFVCSSGGHLDQLLVLLPVPDGWEAVFATFDKPDSRGKLADHRMYPLYWPTNRNLLNLLRNFVVAFKVLRAEDPDIVVSSGAGGAVPFFFLAKLMRGVDTIFIECIDRVATATLTAKMIKRVTDHYVVQWESQLPNFPRRVELGPSR